MPSTPIFALMRDKTAWARLSQCPPANPGTSTPTRPPFELSLDPATFLCTRLGRCLHAHSPLDLAPPVPTCRLAPGLWFTTANPLTAPPAHPPDKLMSAVLIAASTAVASSSQSPELPSHARAQCATRALVLPNGSPSFAY